jgi:hypothetical protein
MRKIKLQRDKDITIKQNHQKTVKKSEIKTQRRKKERKKSQSKTKWLIF